MIFIDWALQNAFDFINTVVTEDMPTHKMRSWELELFTTTTTTTFLVFEGLGTLFESTDVHLNGPNI